MILYLHGFRSSPQSFKAHLIGERLSALGRADEYCCPQLPALPRAAMSLAMQTMRSFPMQELTLIGSSLGGYYATWLAEQSGCRAVLLNPAVHASRDLLAAVGTSTDYHSGLPFEFKREYIDELVAIAVSRITRPERYFLIAATGDEVLDWQEMVQHYPGAQQRIIQGSNHALSDFEQYLEEVLAFSGIEPRLDP